MAIINFDEVYNESSWLNFFELQQRPAELTKSHKLVDVAKCAFVDMHSIFKMPNDLIDEKDLIYQCLFRLFSFSPKEYIKKGKIVQKTWLGSKYHDVGQNVVFDQNCLQYIYHEQKDILHAQYYKTEAKLLKNLSHIFEDYNCKGKIKSIYGVPHLLCGNCYMPLELRSVTPDIAKRIHYAFHYVHTPRTNGYCLGLYLPGCELPFSVLAIEKVDRQYKKAALSRYKISADHAYEITRLYNVHGSPHNTSSFMLAQASSYLKQVDRYWQATISTFAPSYATGGSMFGGGFEQMLFAKTWDRLYEQTPQGVIVRTNRTATMPACATNKTNLMPAVELIYAREKLCSKVRNDSQVLIKIN